MGVVHWCRALCERGRYLDMSSALGMSPAGLRENSAAPPGLESLLPLYPALKRWAKLGRPSGAESRAYEARASSSATRFT